MRTMTLKNLLGLLVFAGLMVCEVTPAKALPAVQGQIQLLVDSATPGAFGEDISLGTIFSARLEAVSADGSVFPQNGRKTAAVTDFFLEIGDSYWDETMTNTPPLEFTVEFVNGRVSGLVGEITPYNPNHPDFFWFPTGRWSAIDRFIDQNTGLEIYRGEVAGIYDTSNLHVAPLPGSLGLFGLGLVGFGWRRLTVS